MELKIDGIEVDCVIGERPDERMRLQRLRVDVRLTVGDKACETDRLEDTVDYVALSERIRESIVTAECRMIERAARIAADAVRSFGGVESGVVSVTKFGAVPGIASATATVSV